MARRVAGENVMIDRFDPSIYEERGRDWRKNRDMKRIAKMEVSSTAEEEDWVEV